MYAILTSVIQNLSEQTQIYMNENLLHILELCIPGSPFTKRNAIRNYTQYNTIQNNTNK